jgi:hypothetical protein
MNLRKKFNDQEQQEKDLIRMGEFPPSNLITRIYLTEWEIN